MIWCAHVHRKEFWESAVKTEAAWKARTGLSAISRRDFGYFPTILAASQGGYGASDSHTYVAVGAGERMLNQALIRVRETLRANPGAGRVDRSAAGGHSWNRRDSGISEYNSTTGHRTKSSISSPGRRQKAHASPWNTARSGADIVPTLEVRKDMGFFVPIGIRE